MTELIEINRTRSASLLQWGWGGDLSRFQGRKLFCCLTTKGGTQFAHSVYLQIARSEVRRNVTPRTRTCSLAETVSVPNLPTDLCCQAELRRRTSTQSSVSHSSLRSAWAGWRPSSGWHHWGRSPVVWQQQRGRIDELHFNSVTVGISWRRRFHYKSSKSTERPCPGIRVIRLWSSRTRLFGAPF